MERIKERGRRGWLQAEAMTGVQCREMRKGGQRLECVTLSSVPRTPMGVQWLRLHLPMQGAQVRSLVRELDPTCHT